MAEPKRVSIGIDIGTTYSSMAYAAVRTSSGFPEPIPQSATDSTGSRIERQFVPSAVCAYVENGEIKWAVGHNAEEIARDSSKKSHIYRTFKLFLGSSLPEQDQNISIDGLHIETNPGDLARKIISYMKDLTFGVNGVLEGYGVSSITVSTPALWTEDRKLYVEDMVRSVFPDVEVRSLEEPISALYHQVNSANHLLSGPEKYVLVVDYGGGTCDVAVVRIKKNAERLQSESKRVADVIGRGSIERGGEIIDRIIAREIIGKHNRKHKIKMIPHKLIKEAEALKISYSNQIQDMRDTSTMLKYEVSYSRNKNYKIQMKKNRFSEILDNELSQINEPITQSLINAGDILGKRLTHENIRHVFLAGGTTLLPLVKEKIQQIFSQRKTSVSFSSLEPRFAIAYGNALHAYHNDTGTGFRIGVSLPESIWLKGLGGVGILIAKKGASLPLEHTEQLLLIDRNKDIKVELYRGNNILVKNDKKIMEPIPLSLKKPLGLFPRLKIYVLIKESGIMDFELTRVGGDIDEKVQVQRRVPVRSDLDEIAERIGKNLIQEDL
ncbi:MAG: Hsp70 family protein [Anaerolineales bacterium]|nr:Hsp70 family protein [Anaerolineales bacterium]